MQTEKLRSMIHRTVKQYGQKVKSEDIDYILDLCDDNYMDELNKVIEAQNRINKIFLLALGKKEFYKIKKEFNGRTT